MGDDYRRWTGLADQRRGLEKLFVAGLVEPAREAIPYGEEDLTRLDRIMELSRGPRGVLLYASDHEYLQQLMAGGWRGDPLPAKPARRRPFIDGVADDFQILVATGVEQEHVVILFSHAAWPGVRFGHRFVTPDESDGYEEIWLKEDIETGRLHRLMSRNPQPDRDGVIWTD